jgi:hypothetical protein
VFERGQGRIKKRRKKLRWQTVRKGMRAGKFDENKKKGEEEEAGTGGVERTETVRGKVLKGQK